MTSVYEGIALCKCGEDMLVHHEVDDDYGSLELNGHTFEAAGTRYRCERPIDIIAVAGVGMLKTYCVRPKYHAKEGVECGLLTGRKLW